MKHIVREIPGNVNSFFCNIATLVAEALLGGLLVVSGKASDIQHLQLF